MRFIIFVLCAIGLHFFYYALVNIKYFSRRLSTYAFDLLFDTQYEHRGEQTADCSLRTSFCQQELTDNLMKVFKLSKSIQSLTWQLNNETSPTNQFGHINRIQKRWELTKELDVPPVVFHYYNAKPKTTQLDYEWKDNLYGPCIITQVVVL